jgi:dUTPase
MKVIVTAAVAELSDARDVARDEGGFGSLGMMEECKASMLQERHK